MLGHSCLLPCYLSLAVTGWQASHAIPSHVIASQPCAPPNPPATAQGPHTLPSLLQEQSQQAAQEAEEALAGRDRHVARLEEALARREAALGSLTAQLEAYRGLTPDGAAALQAKTAALAAAKAAAEERTVELEQRNADAARRVQEGVATWERLQAELQGENTRLAASLADLFQEKEVLRARVAMLEATAACSAGLPHAAAALKQQQEQVPAATDAGSHDLRAQLAAALQKLEARQQAASKYKVCMWWFVLW